MGYRLAGRIADQRIELYLDQGRAVLGSGMECELRIDHPTVSRRHAELCVAPGGLEVLDLGSRNGTYIDTVRIHCRVAADGAMVRFGQVELRVEEVADSDRETAIALDLPVDHVPEAAPSAELSTAGLNPFGKFVDETLGRALLIVSRGAHLTRIAQVVGGGLLDALPVARVEVASGNGPEGLLFQGQRKLAHTGDPIEITRRDAGISLRVTFSSAGSAEVFAPLIASAATLIGLAVDPRARLAHTPLTPSPVAEPEPRSVVPEMRRIYEEAAQVARTDVGVLVCGESGTGKEVLARYLHRASARAAGPFVAINCASLPRDLLESELFGIEKGVATGVERRRGKFELADGGTLFLDEVGDMALETQAVILRVLQEGEVYRIGADAPRQVSVRVLAATNQDLDELIAAGRFRQDLFFRIATWTVHLPALRHRSADIPNLSAFFLTRESLRHGRSVHGISRAAVDALVAYDWPGNIRQLENEMARAVAFVTDGGLLESSRLSPEIVAGPGTQADTPLAERLQSLERREILRTLRLFDGDTATAAEALGIPRSTLYRRMKALGIEASDK